MILMVKYIKQDEEKYIKKIKSIIPKINAAQAEVCEAYQQTINVKDDSKDKDNGNGERKITKISQQRLKDIAKSLNNISRKVKKVMKDDTTHVIDTTQINTLRSSKSKQINIQY